MNKMYLLLTILAPLLGICQTGTSGDPFTSLDQAAALTTPGEYYFKIGNISPTFISYVDGNGYVLVANEVGAHSGALSQGTYVTNSSSGAILSPTALSKLTEAVELRFSSSSGNIDVTTTNSTLISRLQNNLALHLGTSDNAINDTWTGTGAVVLTGDASCNSSATNSLHNTVFHLCGNVNGIHWIPGNNYQEETYNGGQVASGVYFQLWAKGDASSLPIELFYFNAIASGPSTATLNWETASEHNNDYFTIERSQSEADWSEIGKMDGIGNSQEKVAYTFVDRSAPSGIAYYRIKQTDTDGTISYSKTRAVNVDGLANAIVFPNPTRDVIYVSNASYDRYTLYTLSGQVITSGALDGSIPLGTLDSGVYMVELAGENTANAMVRKE